jgi:hypothetical protein
MRLLLGIICTFHIMLAMANPTKTTNNTVINDCHELQNMSNDLSADYELLLDIDCSDLAFSPIGTERLPFTGTLNGTGYTISNLSIMKTDESAVGLFGATEGASITQIGLEEVTVEGNQYTGTLIGLDKGNTTVVDVQANGHVQAGSDSRYIGGLIGHLGEYSRVSDSAANVTVNADAQQSAEIGGLVGRSYLYSEIQNSHASGDVTGGQDVGGLIGYAYYVSYIQDTSASGRVAGYENTGGLIGRANYLIQIQRSHASGAVTGITRTGGLAGLLEFSSTVTHSHAQGTVNATADSTGGLVGENRQSIVSYSYATGTVKGADYTGGLAGYHYYGTINDSYATGNVSGNHYTAGLVGSFLGLSEGASINRTYATGVVNGARYTGGLTGYFAAADPLNSYWDIESTGQDYSASGIGKTTAEMQQRVTYEKWDFVNVWGIDNGQSYPWLKPKS